MLLLIDNYDSFTYNLVQYFAELGTPAHVVRNDALDMATLKQLNPRWLVISPGPKKPADAGISLAAIDYFAQKIPILGVCLGHQCIAQSFGGVVTYARQVMHGKTSEVHHQQQGIFQNLPQPMTVTRYHSLIVSRAHWPECLEEIAWTEQPKGEKDEIMGLRHKQWPIFGVQFHPEAILTMAGHQLLANFLALG